MIVWIAVIALYPILGALYLGGAAINIATGHDDVHWTRAGGRVGPRGCCDPVAVVGAAHVPGGGSAYYERRPSDRTRRGLGLYFGA